MKIFDSLSIVLPLYNPHVGWEDELLASFRLLSSLFEGIDYKIVIVDDGSPTDLSASLAKIKCAEPRVLLHGYKENKGKGHAIRHGIKQVQAIYYIYNDWDFPFGVQPLRAIYDLLTTQRCDLVLGTRGKNYMKALPFKRKIISAGVRFANYLLTNFKIGDTQAGLKGLSNKARDMLLETKTNSFIFEFEFIKKVLKQKLTYTFLTVEPKPNIVMSNFKFKTIKKELITYIKLCFGNNP